MKMHDPILAYFREWHVMRPAEEQRLVALVHDVYEAGRVATRREERALVASVAGHVAAGLLLRPGCDKVAEPWKFDIEEEYRPALAEHAVDFALRILAEVDRRAGGKP